MLQCAATGREFSAGINIEEASFRRLPDTLAKQPCLHYGLVHSWWTREARWVESVPPSQWRRGLLKAPNQTTSEPGIDRQGCCEPRRPESEEARGR
jgi:hypothetical protein